MCNACGKDAECNMKEVNIPFFKNIILMANVCIHCGFKDSEVGNGPLSVHRMSPKKGPNLELGGGDDCFTR